MTTTEQLPVTTDAAGQPTATPQPKVVAATIGAGVGTALGIIGVWAFEASTGIDVPEGVELSVGVVVTAGLAFVGGYFKRPSASAS
jgi:hypothetical protein